MKGIIGKFFFQFGVTITVAVLISLLEALTLAPMRLSRMLEVGVRASRLEQWVSTTFVRLAAGYHRLLIPALRHRKIVLAGATVLFVLSLGIVKLLRQEFIPSQDMSRFGIRFQTPVGSSLDTSERILSQIEAFLRTRPEVDMYGGFVGGFGGGEVNSGFVFVTLKDPADRPVDPKLGKRLSQEDLMGLARQVTSGYPGARIVMQDFSQRGFSPGRGGGFPVEFNIRGPDWDELGRSSRVIMEKMRESGLVTDINSDYQVGMPEVQVFPDRNKAADLGISMSEIGETINSAIGGQRVGKFKDKGRRFDIRVRLLAPQRQRPEDIQRLLVRTSGGGLVRLGDIVRIEQRPTLQTITRRDRQRAITLTANVIPGVSQGEAIDRSMQIAQANLPDGYRVVASGSARTFRESFESLLFAMVLGLIVAYMVLASQFNAFTHPFTVLLALPFSVSGALVALLLGGQSLNVYSMLGIILLMGIAKKNSILLVDFTNQARAQGMERHEALLHACPIRLRPILMTSVATIAGALPPALAIGPGAELQRPMALSIVGGMIVSTALTLFVVPAAYSILGDAVAWNDERKRRGEGLVAALRAARTS
jgi:HAE1 family hydrophobic/amphiphilic exporter-1